MPVAKGYKQSPEHVEKRAAARRKQGRTIDKDGYVILTGIFGHPMASEKSHCARENRVVLYDTIGPGPHDCHWECGRSLTWDKIHADHLNHDRTDNRPENLVPSCGPCNRQRYSSPVSRKCKAGCECGRHRRRTA